MDIIATLKININELVYKQIYGHSKVLISVCSRLFETTAITPHFEKERSKKIYIKMLYHSLTFE